MGSLPALAVYLNPFVKLKAKNVPIETESTMSRPATSLSLIPIPGITVVGPSPSDSTKPAIAPMRRPMLINCDNSPRIAARRRLLNGFKDTDLLEISPMIDLAMFTVDVLLVHTKKI